MEEFALRPGMLIVGALLRGHQLAVRGRRPRGGPESPVGGGASSEARVGGDYRPRRAEAVITSTSMTESLAEAMGIAGDGKTPSREGTEGERRVMDSIVIGIALGALALYVLVQNWSDEVGS